MVLKRLKRFIRDWQTRRAIARTEDKIRIWQARADMARQQGSEELVESALEYKRQFEKKLQELKKTDA